MQVRIIRGLLALLVPVFALALVPTIASAHRTEGPKAVENFLERTDNPSKWDGECGAGLAWDCRESTLNAWYVDFDKDGSIFEGQHSIQFRGRWAESDFGANCRTVYVRANVRAHASDHKVYHDRAYRRNSVSMGPSCDELNRSSASRIAASAAAGEDDGTNTSACYTQTGVTFYKETCPGEDDTSNVPPAGWNYQIETDQEPPVQETLLPTSTVNWTGWYHCCTGTPHLAVDESVGSSTADYVVGLVGRQRRRDGGPDRVRPVESGDEPDRDVHRFRCRPPRIDRSRLGDDLLTGQPDRDRATPARRSPPRTTECCHSTGRA